MYFIGYDIGSSSVKASLVEASTGKIIASDFYPKAEMEIIAKKAGWAEQNPEEWWIPAGFAKSAPQIGTSRRSCILYTMYLRSFNTVIRTSFLGLVSVIEKS